MERFTKSLTLVKSTFRKAVMNRKASTQNDQLLSSLDSGNNYNTMERGDEPSSKKPNKLLKWLKIILIIAIVLCILLVLFVYVGIPLSVYLSSTVRRNVLFLGFLTKAGGLSDPESYGLECSRNFFVTSDPGIRIGTWYMQSQAMPCVADQYWFPGNLTTVLYLHGITKTRSGRNRRELLKKLTSEVQTHAVALDYRGFGDSTDETPSLDGVVADSLAVYKRLRTIMPGNKIVIWGHSLGTSVAMYLAAKLYEQKDDPVAIVLEAGFDSVGNVISHNRLSKPFRWMPYFDKLFIEPFDRDPETGFNSTQMASKINPRVPVLMLHAQDDGTVPFRHGVKLYESIAAARRGVNNAGSVTLIPFNASHHYGHSLIVFYEYLSNIVLNFLNANPEGPSTVDPAI